MNVLFARKIPTRIKCRITRKRTMSTSRLLVATDALSALWPTPQQILRCFDLELVQECV